jgi:hypothetical protein
MHAWVRADTRWGLAGSGSGALAAMRAWRDLWEKWQNRRSRVEAPVADANAVPVAQKTLGCSHPRGSRDA